MNITSPLATFQRQNGINRGIEGCYLVGCLQDYHAVARVLMAQIPRATHLDLISLRLQGVKDASGSLDQLVREWTAPEKWSDAAEAAAPERVKVFGYASAPHGSDDESENLERQRRLIERKCEEEGFDLVSGWKQDRQDPRSKTWPSRLFNWVTARLTVDQ